MCELEGGVCVSMSVCEWELDWNGGGNGGRRD